MDSSTLVTFCQCLLTYRFGREGHEQPYLSLNLSPLLLGATFDIVEVVELKPRLPLPDQKLAKSWKPVSGIGLIDCSLSGWLGCQDFIHPLCEL